jgi:hypothetical protein
MGRGIIHGEAIKHDIFNWPLIPNEWHYCLLISAQHSPRLSVVRMKMPSGHHHSHPLWRRVGCRARSAALWGKLRRWGACHPCPQMGSCQWLCELDLIPQSQNNGSLQPCLLESQLSELL